MKKIKYLILLIFISNAANYLHAQEEIMLEGRIISDSLVPQSVNVVNLNIEKGSLSKEDGSFQIPVRVNDSILFSSLQFETRIIVISEEIFEKKNLVMRVYPKMNELDEIRISDIKLTGNLGEDIQQIKTFKREMYGIPENTVPISQNERMMYTATHSAGGIPLDLLLNTINGKINMLKKVRKNDVLSKYAERGLNTAGISFFVNDLGIENDEVINYLYYCAEKPEFRHLIDVKDVFGILQFYSENLAGFEQLRNGKNDPEN
ncbi:hypothetical protein [Christiangramia antarctica]|uniref:CarboxypepD_reg-like domain-containing protein n=1 Tax=Christiangramia antarctica TaxID=2058158 RepID=A0ABW5XB55_9FLAO|nr:hypothetical protein [Gramella sp. AN32]